MRRRLKDILQRGWRGYADVDQYSIELYLAAILPPLLRARAEANSFPFGVVQEEWGRDLREAADRLELIDWKATTARYNMASLAMHWVAQNFRRL